MTVDEAEARLRLAQEKLRALRLSRAPQDATAAVVHAEYRAIAASAALDAAERQGADPRPSLAQYVAAHRRVQLAHRLERRAYDAHRAALRMAREELDFARRAYDEARGVCPSFKSTEMGVSVCCFGVTADSAGLVEASGAPSRYRMRTEPMEAGEVMCIVDC